MKKVLIAAAILAVSAAPAFAKVYTTKFVGTDGTSATVTFDDVAMTTVDDKGVKGTYTFDAATLKMCTKNPAGDYCLTFASSGLGKPGDSVAFTTADGKSGTATLISTQ